MENGLARYSSGRNENDPRDDAGNAVYQVVRNTKVWLANLGISHWGPRINVSGVVHAQRAMYIQYPARRSPLVPSRARSRARCACRAVPQQVSGWEAHDCVRGASIFGSAVLRNAVINLNSSNAWKNFPNNSRCGMLQRHMVRTRTAPPASGVLCAL